MLGGGGGLVELTHRCVFARNTLTCYVCEEEHLEYEQLECKFRDSAIPHTPGEGR